MCTCIQKYIIYNRSTTPIMCRIIITVNLLTLSTFKVLSTTINIGNIISVFFPQGELRCQNKTNTKICRFTVLCQVRWSWVRVHVQLSLTLAWRNYCPSQLTRALKSPYDMYLKVKGMDIWCIHAVILMYTTKRFIGPVYVHVHNRLCTGILVVIIVMVVFLW